MIEYPKGVPGVSQRCKTYLEVRSIPRETFARLMAPSLDVLVSMPFQ
jgi:hypothetical protein